MLFDADGRSLVDRRGDRAERLGKIDPAQSGRRLRDAAIRPHPDRRRDVTALPPSARPVSMVFQENNLFAHLDVEKNVGLGRSPALRLTAGDRQPWPKRCRAPGSPARRSACRANCPAASASASRWPACSSAIARCCFSTSLSPRSARRLREDMLDLLVGVQAERRMTVLFVTHQPEDARRVADNIVFLEDGTVAASGPTRRFLRRGWTGSVPALYRSGRHDAITRICPEADIIYNQTACWAILCYWPDQREYGTSGHTVACRRDLRRIINERKPFCRSAQNRSGPLSPAEPARASCAAAGLSRLLAGCQVFPAVGGDQSRNRPSGLPTSPVTVDSVSRNDRLAELAQGPASAHPGHLWRRIFRSRSWSAWSPRSSAT